MITIDGSAGEGGGQVLRTALGLSLVTGRSFTIENIRGKRKKPGLMRQHLTAVRAAMEIGSADVRGAQIGSGELTFKPGKICPGNYHFSIGTAGSCTLVFQAILPALLMAEGGSEIVLEGGTHNPMAPPYDFLARTFLPLVNRMGAKVEAELERPGFYPAGGGKMRIVVTPAKKLLPLELREVSNINLEATAVCAQLPEHIARRELKVIQNKLELEEKNLTLVQLDQYGPGNVLSVFVHSEQLTETFTGFGQKNVSAEKVANRTIGQVRTYLKAEVPVGRFLADQLLIPMALAGGGCFRTTEPSSHAVTNIEVVKKFLDIEINFAQQNDLIWEASI